MLRLCCRPLSSFAARVAGQCCHQSQVASVHAPGLRHLLAGRYQEASARAAGLRVTSLHSSAPLSAAASSGGELAACAAASPLEGAQTMGAQTMGDVGTAAAAYAISMTPEQSLLAGVTLGVAAAGKLRITGRVLGISGTYGGVVNGSPDTWRLAFLAGMASGALALTQLMPGAFPVLPESFTVARAAAAGLLVGFGTSMGNGCTSGHGICGNARLSVRSMAATATFMLSGAVVATLAQTAVAAGIPPTATAPYLPATDAQLQFGCLLAAGATLVTVLLRGVAGLQLLPAAAVANAAEFAYGGLFAMGLGLSGMLQPAKVAAFLTPLASFWDPSLMAVMGGALLVATPWVQLLLRRGKAPACAPRMDLPSKTAIDRLLLLGALLFGAGWGLGGMCPGPALVNLAQPSVQGAAFVAAMTLGMLAHKRSAPMWSRVLVGMPKAASSVVKV